jgi:hypothetical protein
MNTKIKNLLEKINMPTSMYDDLKDSKINRIVVYEDKQMTYVYLENPTNFKFEILNQFVKSLNTYANGNSNYKIIVNPKTEDLSLVEEYYKQILIIANNNHLYLDMFGDRLRHKDNKYYIEIYNKHEKVILKKKLEFMNDTFKEYGFSVDLDFLLNEDISTEIKKDISKEYDTSSVKVPETVISDFASNTTKYKSNNKVNPNQVFNKEGVILGKKPRGTEIALRDISYEMDNVLVNVKFS